MTSDTYDPARTRRLVVRGLLVVIAAVAVFNVVAYIVDGVGGAKRGPRSSSYTTSAEGLAAYADLLARAGHPVGRLRADLGEERLASGTTLVLVDPGPASGSDKAAMTSFVENGGRVIAAGASAAAWVEGVVARPPTWTSGGAGSASVAAPAPEVTGVEEIRTAALGRWSDAASGLPVLTGGDGVLAAVETVGSGRVVMLADPSVLQNGLLAFADNAAFGLQVAGEANRPVVFAESVHGYGTEGLAAVPRRWLWALGGLLVATLVYMAAKARRLGPPEELARPLPPPRRDYAEALGGILARTRDATSVARKLRGAINRRLAARMGLVAGADPRAIEEAARAAGLSQTQIGALEREQATEEDLVALGRALAKLESERRPRSRGGNGKVERQAQ